MSTDWDFYFCQVDDHPGSIFVDLGIAKEAPVAGYSVMAYVRIYMQMPREDGLSSQSEFETLCALEDALGSLQSENAVLYVGRNTSSGCRDLYFYARSSEGWEERVGRVMRVFPTYEYACGTRNDPDWNSYFSFLYPSDEDRERIQNRRTCDALKSKGDTLETERLIEHWAYFPDLTSRAAFLKEVTKLGYTAAASIEPESPGDRYGVRLSCVGVPSTSNIDSLTLPLFRAARNHGGEYDGWETQVVG